MSRIHRQQQRLKYLAWCSVTVLTACGFFLLPGLGMGREYKAAISFLLSINLITWLTFYYDKRIAGSPTAIRVPESTLLMLAVMGGLPSAVLAMQVFRHKSAKSRFKWALLGWSLAVYTSVAIAAGLVLYHRSAL